MLLVRKYVANNDGTLCMYAFIIFVIRKFIMVQDVATLITYLCKYVLCVFNVLYDTCYMT